jgi:outer membrane protein assembly factor BamB
MEYRPFDERKIMTETDVDFNVGLTGLIVDQRNRHFTCDWFVGYGGSIATVGPVVDGILYFGACDGFFYAVSMDGKELWRYQSNGQFVESRPVMDNNVIYCGNYDGCMYALGIDGKLLWRFRTGDRITSNASVHDNIVYFGSFDNYLYAVDKDSGREIWRFKTSDRVGSGPLFLFRRCFIPLIFCLCL